MTYLAPEPALLGLVLRRPLAVVCAVFVMLGLPTIFAQEAVNRADTSTSSRVVVTGAELPSAYGAPPAFSRTRFAPTTTAYVLPPGAVLAATIYEGNFFKHGKPDHQFTQEVEVGLPYRFGLAAEFSFEDFDDEFQSKTVSLEARYALANWNKIPLNPTLFVEYKFGTGRILRGEGMEEEEGEPPEPDALRRRMTSRIRHAEEEPGDGEEEGGKPDLPDAVEARLLLAQDFGERIEWALNGFVELETSGDRGREWGFAQSVVTPLTRNEWLKAGVEMQYTNFTDKDTRNDPEHSFVIGPTIAWKPNRWSRFDVSPLFGVTEAAPRVQVFAVFSILFGGHSTEHEAEAPSSTRNR